MANNTMDIETLADYFFSHTSLGSAKWYAKQTGMPLEKAKYAMANQLFGAYVDGAITLFEGEFDLTLCRYLWQRYFTDVQICRMACRAMQYSKSLRIDKLQHVLQLCGVPNIHSKRIINAMYIAMPPLRTMHESDAEEAAKKISQILGVDPNKYKKCDDEHDEDVNYADLDYAEDIDWETHSTTYQNSSDDYEDDVLEEYYEDFDESYVGDPKPYYYYYYDDDNQNEDE